MDKRVQYSRTGSGLSWQEVDVGERLANESASPARGRGGFGRTGSFEPDTEKNATRCQGRPYRKPTQVGE